jgi:hypothetical protein
MAKAKRLYLYSISMTGLVVSVVAAFLVIRLILNHLGVGPSTPVLPGLTNLVASANDKDTISLAIALLVMGQGLWLVHWGILEQMVSAQDESGAAERASIFRSVYFSITLAVSLTAAAALWASLLTDAIADRLGALPASSAADDDWLLTGAIVATAVWGYHAWVRMQDVDRGTPIGGAAAWTSRFYLYGAAAAGVAGMVTSASSLIGTVLSEMAGLGGQSGLNLGGLDLGPMLAPSSGPWWTRPVVAALVGFGIWALVWAAHWRYSDRVCSSPGVLAEPERRSRTRLAYPMIVVFVAAALVGQAFAQGLSQILASGIGVTAGPTPLWYYVVAPPLGAVPAAVAWWWHRQRAQVEATTGPVGVSAARVSGYLTAWVGLYFWGTGAAHILNVLLARVFRVTTSLGLGLGSVADNAWKTDLSAGAALLMVGLVIWGLPWLSAQSRRASDWLTETRSSGRSFYLYLVEATWLLVGVFGAGEVVYRYLRLALGLPEPGLAGEVEAPLAFAVVGGLLVAYHYRIMRRDVIGPPPVPAVVPTPAPQAPPVGPRPAYHGDQSWNAPPAAPPAAPPESEPPAG